MVTAMAIVKVQNQTERNWNSHEVQKSLNGADVTRDVCMCVCVCVCARQVNVNSISSQT